MANSSMVLSVRHSYSASTDFVALNYITTHLPQTTNSHLQSPVLLPSSQTL